MIIYQPIKGYCYNSDTIFLYDFIKHFNIKGRVLDIGTGSGVLALMTARDFKVEIWAAEKQKFMAKYAQINANANKIKLFLKVGDFIDLKFEKKFDFIISNPPFYHQNTLRSKDKIIDTCRFSLHLPLSKMIKKANSILKPRGRIIFCYDAKQISAIIRILKEYKFNIETIRFVYPKKEKEAALVMVCGKKSSKSPTKVLFPFIVFENGKYSKEALKAFASADIHSIKCEI